MAGSAIVECQNVSCIIVGVVFLRAVAVDYFGQLVQIIVGVLDRGDRNTAAKTSSLLRLP